MSSVFSFLKPRTQRYNPPPGPPPSSYNPPPGPPPSASLPPPTYAPAGGQSHEESELNATLEDYEIANLFCQRYHKIPLARVFPTDHKEFSVDRWGLVSRAGTEDLITERTDPSIHVHIDKMDQTRAPHLNHRLVLVQRDPNTHTAYYQNRGDTCLTSNLPIIAGQYSTIAKRGAYFEITIRKMRGEGTTIALGMQCLPYPPNRLPGWHRRSAALHLDDRRIYFEDSEGGTDYKSLVYDKKTGRSFEKDNVPEIRDNDTLGCGYEFSPGAGVGHLFYTYNGALLPIALPRIFDSVGRDVDAQDKDHHDVDVFAAVGVTNGPCQFDVNFGLEPFKWAGPSHFHHGVWTPEEWTVHGLFKDLADAPPPQYPN
ncbi:hypothetical protein B0H17DRAFT_1038844 [Mycena rosella]|uniref:SPRY domain-containing protein n=1 Tax=Mycena rosella TaxID=1033263 RepID=A0AAD7M7R4_MYCRO|nr:hypothetical protein B0H17DRAFT_1038844 [Mycena rosella]